mgnify:FL=1
MVNLFRRGNPKRVSPSTVVLLACAVLIGTSTTWAADRPSDLEIAAAVETALLLEQGVSPHLIDVAVTDGIVTLDGTVSSLLEEDRTVDVTRTVRGVRSIVNQVDVRTVVRSDAEIRRDIESALLVDPATESFEIDVRVEDGVVTLTGTVESWAEKLLAAEVAKGVKGIQAVRNRIEYDYESDRTDRDIKADIEGRLRMDPYVDEELIQVKVNDGVVRLSGLAGSLAEKAYAKDKARVPGVTRVLADDLRVESWTAIDMERTIKTAPVTDKEAERAVEEALLYDPRVPSADVDVEVEDGEATLSGTVENLGARNAAEEDARNTAGIWNIHNEIKVRPTDRLTDTEIAQNVRDALRWNPFVERFEISVLVRNRRVSLAGEVDTPFEKFKAAEVAARVSGVASVDNNLWVEEESWTYTNDAEIREDIESEYFWSPFVDGDNLTIRVDDGHVELAGKVDTWHEYREAVENAFEGGADSVRSYLRVAENEKMYDRYWEEPPVENWPL